MIVHLQTYGTNFVLVYEIVEINGTNIILFKTSLVPDKHVLRACWDCFVQNHTITPDDLVARLINDRNGLSDQLYVLRYMQDSFFEDSVNEREKALLLENRAVIQNLNDLVLAQNFTD